MMQDEFTATSAAGEATKAASSSFWKQTTPVHGLAFVLLTQTLLSLAYINYFCRSFKLSFALVLVHLPLAIGLFVISMIIPGLFLYSRKIRERRLSKYFLVTIPSLLSTLLVLLYLIDYASNFWMGLNINYKLLWLYVSDWWTGGELLSLSKWVWVGLAAIAIVILSIYLVLAKTIVSGLEELLMPDRSNSFFRSRRRAGKTLVIVALLVLSSASYLYLLSRLTPYSELLSSDPILSFARSTHEVYDPSYLKLVSRLKEEEPRCRAGYPSGQKFEKKNVVLITVDSLRADHTQIYGYHRPTTPFLASLYASGKLRKVEFATSGCAETNCGILGTLFSKNLRRQIPEDFKLYDLLHDQGYQTYFVLSGDNKFMGLKEAFGPGLTSYFDGADSTRYKKADDRVIFEGLERVPNSGEAPAFFYIHLMSPHLIGIKQEAFRIYQPSAVKNDWGALFKGEYDQETVNNNYDNGVTQADATIRDVFAALERKGYLPNSIVVILADHGEGLGDRGKASYGHVTSLYQEFIRIPLLIYDESPTLYANLEFATQIDVAPTIVQRLGLSVPRCWEGMSLLSSNRRTISIHQTTLRSPCYAVLSRADGTTYKYIYCSRGRTEELFDLGKDPGEQTNLIDSAPSTLVKSLRDELARWLQD